MANRISFRPARLACLIAAVLGVQPDLVFARDTFDPALIELDNHSGTRIDLSSFEAGSQAPGTYRVDVVLGNEIIDTRDIRFVSAKSGTDSEHLVPCLSVAQLKAWGVKTEQFPQMASQDECATLTAIPQATTDFQFHSQRLVLNIPQAAVNAQARGYVPPEQWDEGINAAMLNYALSGANNWARTGKGEDSDSYYANLRPGINIGPWRLRNYTTWSRDDSGKEKWDTVYTYAQRGISPLKAQLTAGDSTAPAEVFDSIPFRGLQLASDDDMLPDSLKGYAPVVRGIARTNAQVIVRQNGYQIYQNYVAPGAFEITDMYPTGGAGDLDVTVKEADGSEQRFTVPFASLPVLQREGRLKYALTGGQYRSYDGSVKKTPFAQLTGIYGLSHGFTIYGGVQESSKYQSLAAGLGINMGEIGAVSADVTQAWATPKDQQKADGQSWRVRYSKNFVETGTNFAIAGYRYATSGYYDMQEILDSYGNSNALSDRRKNRSELTLNQSLGSGNGTLSLSAMREDYWNSSQSMSSYSAGYNNGWRGISYGLTYTYSQNVRASRYSSVKSYDKDHIVAFNVSIPLEKFLPSTWANYSVSDSKNNGTTHSLGLSGMALENNALNWNVQQGYSTEGVGYTGSMNASYKGTYGEATAGYGYDKNSNRLNYGVQGGIIAHGDGVTFSQQLGETNVLVKAPGAKGVDVQNQNGARTDYRGYTAISNVTPFRKNTVVLGTENLPDDIELELTSQTVIPTRGAVSRAHYSANVGLRALMTLMQVNGNPVPFGAIVNVSEKAEGFIVGDGGQVYLTGLAGSGNIQAKWGDKPNEKCRAAYLLNAPEVAGIQQLTIRCE